ncbi:hypothetical protein F5Y17DRAFT_460524 [Xylariaceae sp. FL0594]|nr:hypothetical protein F5Y17DRAFT_460524 [Xylariaceae sp. FL0594]
MKNLPTELILEIAKLVDDDTLKNLALTCRFVYESLKDSESVLATPRIVAVFGQDILPEAILVDESRAIAGAALEDRVLFAQRLEKRETIDKKYRFRDISTFELFFKWFSNAENEQVASVYRRMLIFVDSSIMLPILRYGILWGREGIPFNPPYPQEIAPVIRANGLEKLTGLARLVVNSTALRDVVSRGSLQADDKLWDDTQSLTLQGEHNNCGSLGHMLQPSDDFFMQASRTQPNEEKPFKDRAPFFHDPDVGPASRTWRLYNHTGPWVTHTLWLPNPILAPHRQNLCFFFDANSDPRDRASVAVPQGTCFFGPSRVHQFMEQLLSARDGHCYERMN